MKIKQNEQLAPYTTFKIGGPAKFFCVAKNETELKEAVKFSRDKHLKLMILGGGSNMLISDQGFDGLAVQVDFMGWEVKEHDDDVILKVACGEVWDKIVELAVSRGWWGIENLSHIPGKTGAIAVQNVGAYGQEAAQVVDKVTVFEVATGEIFNLDNIACGFGYRRSLFNAGRRGEFVILHTYLKLSKQPRPNLWYRDLNQLFLGKKPSLSEIREAVIAIRDKKFPFPKHAKNGNAGSFFKNLIVERQVYDIAKAKMSSDMGAAAADLFEQKKISLKDGGHVKIPAAFLLDICGFKGIKHKNVAINQNQPLVIINATGKATAAEVLALAAEVIKTVKQKTGLTLQIEPELVGFTSEDLKKYDIIE